jgi:hypothetical protein
LYVKYDDAVAASEQQAIGIARAICLDIEALSNAALVGRYGLTSEVQSPLSYGAAADYANAETKARIVLIAADFTLHGLSIPAPLLSMFEADRETVLGSAIATLLNDIATPGAAANTYACTRGGVALPAPNSVGGMLVRKPFQRKLTIYDKSSGLDEPEE